MGRAKTVAVATYVPNLIKLGDGTSAGGFGSIRGEVLDLCGSLLFDCVVIDSGAVVCIE